MPYLFRQRGSDRAFVPALRRKRAVEELAANGVRTGGREQGSTERSTSRRAPAAQAQRFLRQMVTAAWFSCRGCGPRSGALLACAQSFRGNLVCCWPIGGSLLVHGRNPVICFRR